MVQFNLLPDVKLEYVHTRRTQRLVIGLSALVSVVALAIFIVLLLFVNVAQKKNLRNIAKDISKTSSTLTNTPNLNKILTVQNQLSSLPSLDTQKPAVTRLFAYITQLTPSDVFITKLNVDTTQNLMTISGTASSIDTINTYADTLKFTTYASVGNDKATNTKAFSNVVLSAFNRASSQATYTITLNFDPIIFNINDSVTLTVPNIISTRSEVSQPSVLFEKSTTSTGSAQ